MKTPSLFSGAVITLLAIAITAAIWKLKCVTRERDELQRVGVSATPQPETLQKDMGKAAAEEAAHLEVLKAEEAALAKKQEALEEYQKSLSMPLRPGTILAGVVIRGRRFDELEVISVSSSTVSFRNQRSIVNAALGELPPEIAARAVLQEKVAPQYVPKNAPKPTRIVAQSTPTREAQSNRNQTVNNFDSGQYEETQIKAAAARHARNYFLDEYQNGSNSSVTLRMSVTTETPEPRSGWDNEWRVCGRASFTNYNSIGWGSFAKDGRDFEVIIYWKNGTSKVKDFTLR